MAESLDGGAVTKRSARHFDILNENIVFPLHAATTVSAYRNIYDSRRTDYAVAPSRSSKPVSASVYEAPPKPATRPTQAGAINEFLRNSSRASGFERCTSTAGSRDPFSASYKAYEE